jgi:hypothetical protein
MHTVPSSSGPLGAAGTTTRKAAPNRKLLKIANALLRAKRWVGFREPPLTIDGLMTAARRQAGSTDFGDEAFVEALTRLLRSIEEEAVLTPVARSMLRFSLTRKLEIRLRAQAAFTRNPEILEEEIRAPVFITGFPRTGTTMLHRLIATDGGLRSLAFWEALYPVPLSDGQRGGRDPRQAKASAFVKGLKFLMPEFNEMHPIEPDLPDEELLLLELSFLDEQTRPSGFIEWAYQQDQAPAYAYLKKMLQLLQWQNRRERWILKAPIHLGRLDTLFAVFPDAKVIWTHRDPVKAFASVCSMMTRAKSSLHLNVDPPAFGLFWAGKFQESYRRALAFRKRAENGRVLDVYYDKLVTQPLAEVASIYQFIGRSFSQQTIARMKQWLNDHPKNKFGRHKYALEDLGLSRAAIEGYFAEYRARFGIPHE